MDPCAALADLLSSINDDDCDLVLVSDLAEGLTNWLRNGGFMPAPHGPEPDETKLVLNRRQLTVICEAINQYADRFQNYRD